MKKTIYFISVITLVSSIFSCQNQESESVEGEVTPQKVINYAYFGDTISPESALTSDEVLKLYAELQEGDTVPAKFLGNIETVCQKKGCWMNVQLSEEESTFVRFKDYGFFMPLNAAGSEAILEGQAFISVVSVEERQHYAEDEGLSAEEIAAITEPEITYGFLAHGVLIKE